jgi:hypothetical protein
MACRRRCDWTRRRDEATKGHQRPPKATSAQLSLAGAHLRFLQSWILEGSISWGRGALHQNYLLALLRVSSTES